MRVRWALAASRHLEEIGDYIGRDNPAAADRTVRRIVDQTEALSDHSHLGRAGRADRTRELPITGTPYLVAYRVSGDVVEILAVLHGARRWPDKFD